MKKLLDKLYTKMLKHQYGVDVYRSRGKYKCWCAGTLISTYTLPEMRERIINMR